MDKAARLWFVRGLVCGAIIGGVVVLGGFYASGSLGIVVIQMGDADRPDANSIYVGSLTFAGLVLFGSVFLQKVVPAQRQDSWYRKLATICLFEGTLLLAMIHVAFAMASDAIAAVATIVLMGVIHGGYIVLTWPKKKLGGQGKQTDLGL